MKTRVTKFLLQAGMSFGLIVSLLVVTVGIIYYAQTTLLDIEQTLPVTVLEQEREAALLIQETSELVSLVQLARVEPSPRHIDDVLVQLQVVDERLKWIRGSYNFDNLIGASAMHAVANPALADIKVWLKDGVYGFAPTSLPVLRMVEIRSKDALKSMKVLFAEASETASDILKMQSARIEVFRNGIIIVLIVLAAMGGMLVFHAYRRWMSEGALRRSEERFRALYNQSPLGVVLEDYSLVKRQIDRLVSEGVTDFKQYLQEHENELKSAILNIRLLDANDTQIEMFGVLSFQEYKEYEKNLDIWRDAKWCNFYIEELTALVMGELTYTTVVQDFKSDGTLIELKCITRIVRGHEDDWSEIITTHEDITARKVVEKQLVQQATIDQVTGLPNRALLFDRLARAIEHARREQRHVGLIFVDLDRFKQINDSHGHAAGDLLLKKIGESLSQLVRQEDTVARLGGDEFIVLLNDVELPTGPEVVAMKIVDAFSKPFDLEGRETFITASLGIAIFPNDGHEPEILLQHADAAMYNSKHQGRNTFRFFTPGLNDQAALHGRIAERLRHALERDDFELHFQPVVDVRDDRIVAVEALIRWDDAVLNIVAPEQLVSVAEETGFILPIDKWVLGVACHQVAAWRTDVAPSLELSVNISISHFRGPGLVDAVQRALTDSRLPAAALTIEITENLLIEDSPKILQRLNKLTALGVKLALDDFGTGYSSLGYLKRFNVNTLKIDRSFVRAIAEDPGDLALVEAIIAMSRSLGLTVIAEGVESIEQLELLQARGCCLIQGFYFSKALAAEEMTKYLSKPMNKAGKGNVSKDIQGY